MKFKIRYYFIRLETASKIHSDRCLYVQASFSNVKEILKIKESFSNILSKKIKEIYKTINNPGKIKPRINMITKRSSR